MLSLIGVVLLQEKPEVAEPGGGGSWCPRIFCAGRKCALFVETRTELMKWTSV
jgi:hypothetical protein